MHRNFITFLLILLIILFLTSCEITDNRAFENEELKPGNNSGYNTTGVSEIKCGGKKQERNEVVVKRLLKSIGRESVKPALNAFADNAELWFTSDRGIVFLAGKYNGQQEIKQYFTELFSAINIIELKKQFTIVDNSRIHCHFNLKAFIICTGKIIDLEFIFACEYNETNKIRNLTIYYDSDLWRKGFINDNGVRYLIDQKGSGDFIPVESVDFDAAAVAAHIYDRFFNYGDLSALVSRLSEDIVWTLKGDESVAPIIGTFYGIPAVAEWFSNLVSLQRYDYVSEISFIAEGNRVDVWYYEETYVYQTGKYHKTNSLHSLRFDENGRIIEFKDIPDTYQVNESFRSD